jgi:hypothetical protein
LSFALGRQLQSYDEPAVQRIVVRVQEMEFSAAVLFQEVDRSDPFLHQSHLTDEDILAAEWN